MDVLATCKYEEDTFKNENSRAAITFSLIKPYMSYLLN